jgi:hypothetical protein
MSWAIKWKKISCRPPACIVLLHDYAPGAVIEQQLKATQETFTKLLALPESSEADKFVAHLYQARKQYRLVCERPNKGNKAIERNVISTYQVAQSLGFKGELLALPRRGDSNSISRVPAPDSRGHFSNTFLHTHLHRPSSCRRAHRFFASTSLRM